MLASFFFFFGGGGGARGGVNVERMRRMLTAHRDNVEGGCIIVNLMS